MKKETEKEIQIFLNNVALLRKKHGLSKKAMAKILGIGVASLNKLESGILPPRVTVDVFFRIYNYFGISPTEQLRRPIK